MAGASGDALGLAIEFNFDRNRIVEVYGPGGIRRYGPTPYGKNGQLGKVSDDTQMHLFSGEALLEGAKLGINTVSIAKWGSLFRKSYLGWYRTQMSIYPFVESFPDMGLLGTPELWCRRAPGTTCLGALKELHNDAGLLYSENDSKGCGGVMRSASCGLVFNSPHDAWDVAYKSAQITHGHPDAIYPAAALAWLISKLIYDTSLPDIKTAVIGLVMMMDSGGAVSNSTTHHLLHKVIRFSDVRSHIDEKDLQAYDENFVDNHLGGGWTGDEALAIAVYACLAYPDNLEEAVIRAVNHGGDSDSTGSIAGNIMGAFHGESAIPQAWLEELELLDTLRGMADSLYEIRGSTLCTAETDTTSA